MRIADVVVLAACVVAAGCGASEPAAAEGDGSVSDAAGGDDLGADAATIPDVALPEPDEGASPDEGGADAGVDVEVPDASETGGGPDTPELESDLGHADDAGDLEDVPALGDVGSPDDYGGPPGDDAGLPVGDAGTPEDAGGAEDVVPDPGPPPPEPIVVMPAAEAADVEQTTLLDGAAVAAASLPEATVAVAEGQVLWHDGEESAPLGPAPDGVTAAARLDDGTALLLTTGGLWIASAEQLAASPLNGLVDSPVQDVAVVAGADSTSVWLATAGGVWLWRDGKLYPLEIPEVPLAAAQLAAGPAWDGVPALWVGAPNALTAVIETEGGVEAWSDRDDLTPDDMAADAEGRLWVVAGGDVHRREEDASWSWFVLPAPASRVVARTDQAAVWIGAEDAAWHVGGSGWRPIVPAPAAPLALDDTGRALVATSEALLRVGVDAPPEPEPEPISWTADIQPLFVANCAKCHGQGQFAHPLYTSAAWIAEIGDIILVTSTGAMPLPPNPPLTKAQVDLIKKWQADGFVE